MACAGLTLPKIYLMQEKIFWKLNHITCNPNLKRSKIREPNSTNSARKTASFICIWEGHQRNNLPSSSQSWYRSQSEMIQFSNNGQFFTTWRRNKTTKTKQEQRKQTNWENKQ